MIGKIKEKGITLIALVITIILLLILIGVTINVTLSENGLLSRAKEAAKKQKISEYIEKVELARGEAEVDDLGNVTLDSLIEQLYENGVVKEGSISKIQPDDGSDATQAQMTTDEGYIFVITEETETYVGDEGEVTFSNLTWDTNTHTASVTIIKGKDVDKNLKIQYQIGTYDNDKWQTGEETVTLTEIANGKTIYARLSDGSGYASIKILDNTPPQDAKITVTNSDITVEDKILATVILQDNETGVNVVESKWVCNVNDQNNLAEEEFTNNFSESSLTQNLEIEHKLTEDGNCYIHILTKDYAGNVKQTVSGATKIIGKYTITYNANGGTGEPSAQSKTHGKDLTLSDKKPTKENSVFLGWSENKTDTKGKYQASSSYTDNKSTTLYAIWHTHQDSCYSTACTGTFTKVTTTEVYATCSHTHSSSNGCYSTGTTSCSSCGGSGKKSCTGSFSSSGTTSVTCSNCGKTVTCTVRRCSTCGASSYLGHCSDCRLPVGGGTMSHSQINCSSCGGSGRSSYSHLSCSKGSGTKTYSRNVDTYTCSTCKKSYTYKSAANNSCTICKGSHNVSASGSIPGAHNAVSKYLICEYK